MYFIIICYSAYTIRLPSKFVFWWLYVYSRIRKLRLKLQGVDIMQGHNNKAPNALIHANFISFTTMAPTTPKKKQKAPRKEYSPHTRGRVFSYWESGRKYKWISEELSVPTNSIPGIVRRYRQQHKGQSVSRSGRPKILQERDVRHILRLAKEDPFISTHTIRNELGFSASVTTIYRVILQTGLRHWKALRRPKLSEEHAAKRLAFAESLVDKPMEWWKTVIFSDETSIQRGCGDRQKWVWCHKVSLCASLSHACHN